MLADGSTLKIGRRGMYHSLPDTISEKKKKKGQNLSDSERINDCQILWGLRE